MERSEPSLYLIKITAPAGVALLLFMLPIWFFLLDSSHGFYGQRGRQAYVQVPEAVNSSIINEDIEKKKVTIVIGWGDRDSEAEYFIGNKWLPKNQLEKMLGHDSVLYLVINRNAEFGRINEILKLAQKKGIPKVCLVTRSQQGYVPNWPAGKAL